MTRYAEGTKVSSANSRAEIERILSRFGADQFMYGWKERGAVVAFRMRGRNVRFALPMPDRDDPDFTRTPSRGTPRTPEAAEAAYEKAVRQRWRALALVIKAKLVAVEEGVTEFEDEFLAHILLPDGTSAGDFMRPQIALAYESGDMPALLPDYSGGKS